MSGRVLTEVLQTITAQLDGVEEQLGGIQERLGEIEAHIVELKTQTRASNANHIVRLHNSLSHSLENHILPLVIGNRMKVGQGCCLQVPGCWGAGKAVVFQSAFAAGGESLGN